MIYLLDTNVVAELTTRRTPSRAVLSWLDTVPKPNRFLSVVTIAEIADGVHQVADVSRRTPYETALERVRTDYAGRIIPIGEAEATAFVSLHRTLRAAGNGIDPPDAPTAATALARGWTVATRNVKHFARTGILLVNPWEHDAPR